SGGSLTVTDSQFANNSSSSLGGAIYIRDGDVSCDRCSFEFNSAVSGGAINASKSTGTLYVNIHNSTFDGNSALDSGGAIAVTEPKNLLLENSTISGNKIAGGKGGGLYANIQGALTAIVRNSTITNNTADGLAGGGVCVVPITANTLNVISTIV